MVHNPTSTSPYRVEATPLADLIFWCHAKIAIIVPNSFSILGDLNLNFVWWATVASQGDNFKNFLLQN